MKHWKLFGVLFLALAVYTESAYPQQQQSQNPQQAQTPPQAQAKIPAGSKVFVAPMGGFETPLR